jgi:hypothetical protein
MKCCICGTVRNCGKYLEKVFSNIEKIGTIFDEYVIIVYYDVSNDNTLEFLKQYREKNNKLIFYVNKDPLSKYRTHRIAKGRNKCLNMIRSNYKDYDFFIMMDFDDVCAKKLNLDVLKNKMLSSEWDALSFSNSANGSIYYDIWALSIQPYLFSYRHFNHQKMDCAKKMHDYIVEKLKKMPKGQLLPCASAFCGFSIYKTDKFINCNYDGKLRIDLIPKKLIRNNILAVNGPLCFTNYEGTIHEDCEHRSFHLEAIHKNNSRIRISPEKLFE